MSRSLLVAASLEEALGELADGARPVAGGTDLVVGARQGKAPLPERLVAIHRLAELDSVKEVDGFLHVGAGATHARIVGDPFISSTFTALADASAIVGSHATRAQGTIGGNVMNASPAADTVAPLICFGASLRLRSRSSARTVPVDGFATGPGATCAAPDELLEAIEIPIPGAGVGSAYLRLEYRRQMEIAVVGVAALIRLDGAQVADAKIAITALAPTVRRVPEAEQLLIGSPGDDDTLTAVAAAVTAASKPISDVRASAAYRSAMAGVIGRRAVITALERAR